MNGRVVVWGLLAVLAGGVADGARAAQIRPRAAVTGAESNTVVTVYTHDLGFIRQEREIAAGDRGDTLRLEDVPRQIDVSSVRFVPRAGRLLRLAYRNDGSTGDALLDAARGRRVRVTLRGDRTVEGTLVSADAGWLVIAEATGGLRSLSRAAVEDVAVPDGGRPAFTRPGLEAVVEGARSAGTVRAEMSYLTGGLSWAAEHTLVRSGETGGTWSSSVTVDNTTGRDFTNVGLRLVAGEPRRESPRPVPMPMARGGMIEAFAAKTADLSEEAFAEYHLYTLDRPATLRDQETQKLTMLEPRRVTLTPRYLYRASDGNGVRTQLEVVNDAKSGLGVPLPGGRVRVYEPGPGGELGFTGEVTIPHTAAGEKLTLDVGQAFDLVGERREVSNTQISDRERESTVEITLRNRKHAAVTIVVEEAVGGDVTVLRSTPAVERKDANTLRFTVPVAAGETAVVTYTARFRY
jgi:hypothetical protein